MRRLKYAGLFCATFALAMVMCSTFALAYIDPSAMSYIIQIVAGVVIAGGAAFGFYWRKLRRAFKKKDGESVKPTAKAAGKDDGQGYDDYDDIDTDVFGSDK